MSRADRASPESPHDKLVKWAFGQPKHAASHLRTVVPPELAARVRWASLKLEPGSYVDANMRYLHTDLLFSTKLAQDAEQQDAEQTVLFYLVEHQSTPDRLMAVRMFSYAAQALMSWLRRQPSKPERIPAILPIVLYDGKPRWTPSVELADLVDLPEELREACRPYLPKLRYLLHDLWREDDVALRQRSMSALALLTLLSLKHARNTANLQARLLEWQELFPAIYNEPGGRQTLHFLIDYYLVVNQTVTTEDLSRGLEAAFGDKFEEVEEEIMSTGQQLIEKGLRKGRQEGRQEGRREALRELLDAKFGPLPDDVAAKLQAAAADELGRWLRRLLSATTLDEVFEGA